MAEKTMTTTQPEPYTGTFSERVIAWAKDRNIIGGSTPRDQFLKLTEEIGEIYTGLLIGNREEIKDGIGDSAVVIQVMAGLLGVAVEPIAGRAESVARAMLRSVGDLSHAIQKGDDFLTQYYLMIVLSLLVQVAEDTGLDFDDCCEHAWNEIKHRKGTMINGVFVRESQASEASTVQDDIESHTLTIHAELDEDREVWVARSVGGGFRGQCWAENAETAIDAAKLMFGGMGDSVIGIKDHGEYVAVTIRSEKNHRKI